MKKMKIIIKNGIKTDCSKEIAEKIVSLLFGEKCTVKEAHIILSLAADIVNDSAVTVQSPDKLECLSCASV